MDYIILLINLSKRGVRMPKASARHILVKQKNQCEEIKLKILNGAKFTDMAKKFSLCPSGETGGELGTFEPGMMVAAFDKVVFEGPVGEILGPVETEFGFHLIEVTKREK